MESESLLALRGAPGHPLVSSWKIQRPLPFWRKGTWRLEAEGLGWAGVPPTRSNWRGVWGKRRGVIIRGRCTYSCTSFFFLQMRKLKFKERKRLKVAPL